MGKMRTRRIQTRICHGVACMILTLPVGHLVSTHVENILNEPSSSGTCTRTVHSTTSHSPPKCTVNSKLWNVVQFDAKLPYVTTYSWQPGLLESAGPSLPIRRQVLVNGSVCVHWRWHSRYMDKHCQSSLTYGLTDSRLVSAGPDLYTRYLVPPMPNPHQRHHWSKASRSARSGSVGAKHSDACRTIGRIQVL